jgi:hypothetical protein
MTLKLVVKRKPSTDFVTHIESVTDRAGLGQLDAAMRRHHVREITASHVKWRGRGDARLCVSKLDDDQYRLIYSALSENDPEILSAFAAVCCKVGLKIHCNSDEKLHARLRATAIAFQADHRPAPARSFLAAAAIFAAT